ncbi:MULTISPECIES: hypothetical protein [Nocardia]|uniref:hypothetical protein n=1 Tax=Nocardia TaxID=1817 RepID=UPI000BEF7825|nr:MULTISPECIES: hypothetical protein [Nocardia]MBF6185675.1 hypothetical protein [Nocardia farcinica]MBF6311520.1 hypothetical protein [Nocardia farcinica]MBF6408504.1 hypothetical protein [Nocardia farcinica]PEH79883.1 hypothetical protein CRM89_12715 [Nocardia sp. FDAARGOS_372]UEX21132.1 hypothetical protein LMJ57_19200 [Nocardia farcinica]
MNSASPAGSTSALHAPQLIANSRMLYLVWLPADPEAVAKLVPAGLTPREDRACYLNQYVVDDPMQTSNGAAAVDSFGAYSLTYLGVDLADLDTEAGVPARWWTHYFNSSEAMNRYAAERGVPASGGHTELTVTETGVVATTFLDGTPTIRTTARFDAGPTVRSTGQLRYVTRDAEGFVSGRYPFVAEMMPGFTVESLEFLDPTHDVYALRPADPLTVTFGFYSPDITFCYPGGEGPLGSRHGR